MIASDLNNPEFVGAADPDARLSAVFFKKPMQNDFKTQIEGRPIFEDVLMIRILIPGDQLNIIETPVREDHKTRFPKHWAYFERTQGADNLEVGTPLSQWPQLQPSNVEMLKAMKFSTVDQIASASDEQITRLGNGGGMAPFTLRDKARRFLLVARDSSAVDQAARELAEVKQQAAEREAQFAEQMRAMQEQMQQLAAKVGEPSKRGPKPKVKEVVEP